VLADYNMQQHLNRKLEEEKKIMKQKLISRITQGHKVINGEEN
jgi:hypothetical protein